MGEFSDKVIVVTGVRWGLGEVMAGHDAEAGSGITELP